MADMHPEGMKRLRGQILELLDENHRKQRTRYDLVTLWGVLSRLGHDLGQADVVTVLQDLKDRRYVEFASHKDRWLGHVKISQLQITPAGRDLTEGTTDDPAVLLE